MHGLGLSNFDEGSISRNRRHSSITRRHLVYGGRGLRYSRWRLRRAWNGRKVNLDKLLICVHLPPSFDCLKGLAWKATQHRLIPVTGRGIYVKQDQSLDMPGYWSPPPFSVFAFAPHWLPYLKGKRWLWDSESAFCVFGFWFESCQVRCLYLN